MNFEKREAVEVEEVVRMKRRLTLDDEILEELKNWVPDSIHTCT
jgi:hypothetical protein